MRIERNLKKQIDESNKNISRLLSPDPEQDPYKDPNKDPDEDDMTQSLIGFSYLGLEPGDIIVFNYSVVMDERTGEPIVLPHSQTPTRMGIVVTSERTDSGYFVSTRNNTLLNVFLLDSLTKSFYKVVVNTLYLDEIRCDYYRKPKLLEGFLKKENFRTFNVKYVKNIRKVILKDKNIKKAGKSQRKSRRYSANLKDS